MHSAKFLILLLVVAMLVSCLTPYQAAYDYRSELQAAPAFETALDPVFVQPEPATASEASRGALADLRARFRLDELAAEGTTLQKAFRLMQWFQDQTTQDGAASSAAALNAADLLTAAIERGQALNCRASSVVLHELLSALGLQTRILGLIPKRPSNDMHVVVILWVAEWSKWVFLDPSYNTAVFDPQDRNLSEENRIPLSPLELRALLAAGETPLYSARAGWNGGPFDLDYAHYLSKNCFAFRTNVSAAVGYEGLLFKQRSYLLPPGYDVSWLDLGLKSVTHSASSFFSAP